ncbi:Ornithine decarboxylase antizyme [Aphelenchoides besseyi]|nr:Ornithine decarboxylase antizyme [Aphelenchoides besseyi]KAI6208498.1 Ornithine decarboxylase antizyme [Aphelenchoides besseyi]
MSTMMSCNTNSTVIDAVQKRRGAGDIATQLDENADPDALSGLVKSVCDEWCCHIPEKSTLALFLPQDVIPSKLSREHFIQLLEHCEEVLDFKRVLVCFNKKDIDPRQGIPRVLKCIGFSVLHPNSYPAWIDSKSIFAMVYNI